MKEQTFTVRTRDREQILNLLSLIIGTTLSWPYRNGSLVLGTWQGVYFIELDGPRERKVTVYV